MLRIYNIIYFFVMLIYRYKMSVFDIPKDFNQIQRPNKGISDFYFKEVNPSTGPVKVNGSVNNFSGEIVFKHSYDELEAWNPAASFWLLRLKLGRLTSSTNPILQGDDIGFNLNPIPGMFSKKSVYINDKQIHLMSNYIAQTDTLTKRQSMSSDYMKSHSDTMFLDSTFTQRHGKTTGYDNDQFKILTKADLGYSFDSTIVITVGTGAIAISAAANTQLYIANPIKLGDIIVINGVESTISGITDDQNMAGSYIVSVTANANWYVKRPIIPQPGAGQSTQEIVYYDSHPFLKIDKAIPMCNLEIKVTPLPNLSWQKSLIQSVSGSKTPDTDYTVYIDKFVYMAAMYKLPKPYRVKSAAFELDCIECLPKAISTSGVQEIFNVHPRTHGITIAVQDTNSTSINTRYPQTIFKTLTGTETNITDLTLKYAGKQKPDSLTDFKYSSTEDNLKSRYIMNYYNLGFYPNNVVPESYNEWISRGIYQYFPFDKDPSNTDNIASLKLTHTVGSHNVLFFHHYKDFVAMVWDDAYGKYKIVIPGV